MIPISESSRGKGVPWLTWTLLALNTGLYIFTAYVSSVPFEWTLKQFGFVPAEMKSLSPRVILTVWTSLFLHGGIMHLLGNMIFLNVFGPRLERTLGALSFLKFYLVSGLCASLFHGFQNLDSSLPLVGASGAISGLLGAYLLMAPFEKITLVVPLFIFFPTFDVRAFVWIGLWGLMQFFNAAIAQTPEVAWWAHIGGFLAGGLMLLGIKIIDFGRR